MGYIPEMTINEFKIKLGLKDPKGRKKEKYKEFSDFRKKVLEPAKQQINDLTDITIDYVLSKRGRSYYWIKFLLNGRAIQQLEIDFDTPIEEQKIFSTIKRYGIADDFAVMIAKQGANEFEKHKEKAMAKINKGEMDVDAFAPYIVSIYQKKGFIPKKIKS